jgi:hypothetical protein
VGHLYLVLSADVVGLVFVEVRVLANAEKVVILTVMMAVFNSRHFQFPAGGPGDEEGEYIRIIHERDADGAMNICLEILLANNDECVMSLRLGDRAYVAES